MFIGSLEMHTEHLTFIKYFCTFVHPGGNEVYNRATNAWLLKSLITVREENSNKVIVRLNANLRWPGIIMTVRTVNR